MFNRYVVSSLILLGAVFSSSVQALPSFARQTGMACTSCHVQAYGPDLNTMGRQFKLKGYTQGGGDDALTSRISGMVMGSLTNTKKDDPNNADRVNKGLATNNANNNIALDQASVFYGGKVFDKMGALIQVTYDGYANSFAWDNTDIRLADEADIANQYLIYGVSFNNNPTVQDLWNTTSAWGYPYVASNYQRTPTMSPVISSLGGQVGGASIYSLVNDTLYVEAGAYSSFAKYAQKGMGQWSQDGAVKINGGAPYWRIALQQNWQGHYFELGHFGMKTDIQPDVNSTATDRFTDLGVDFNYQYLADTKHIYEFKGSYIREQQQLNYSFPNALSSNANQQIGFLGVNGSYTYNQTYSLSLGYNKNYGNKNSGSYFAGGDPEAPSKLNAEYFTTELDYVPFGKQATTGPASYLNLRLALQYIAFTRFDGADKNYFAGNGRSASDNNTLYFNTWLTF